MNQLVTASEPWPVLIPLLELLGSFFCKKSEWLKNGPVVLQSIEGESPVVFFVELIFYWVKSLRLQLSLLLGEFYELGLSGGLYLRIRFFGLFLFVFLPGRFIGKTDSGVFIPIEKQHDPNFLGWVGIFGIGCWMGDIKLSRLIIISRANSV